MKMKVKAITPKKGAFEKQAWDALNKRLTTHIESWLRNIRCPDHHERPRVKNTGTQQKPGFNIEGCCQKLIDQATEALK
jgi:hypothetical protein